MSVENSAVSKQAVRKTDLLGTELVLGGPVMTSL